MRNKITKILENALNVSMRKGQLPEVSLPYIEVEAPANPDHGDYAANAALILASQAKQNPRKIAQIIQENISDPENIIEKTQIAGPGFVNFFLKDALWHEALKNIDEQNEKYGSIDQGGGKKVQVEFVSANPTGPLHIGHARGAVVGDVIANLLMSAGYRISKEYYINDAGNQMNNLGKSVLLRYRELTGEKIEFPETCYRGDYIKEISGEILSREGDKYLKSNEEETIRYFTSIAGQEILEEIKIDLRDFGVTFDEYFSEKELYKNDGVTRLLDKLQKQGFIYSDGETLWFKTTDFGDEKDRVVIRKNGEPTYFAADIAYHLNKFSRGFEMIIDIWGADHHGYMPRMWAGIQALGYDKNALKIILVQLVNLLRGGVPAAMSTRSGEFVTLREVLDEVGKDAARYNFLMRRSDSHLDFDLELAKKQSSENPVYYVQYAHARICSILKMAQDRGVDPPVYADIDPALLDLPEEKKLIKLLVRYPETIFGAARSLEPHRVTFYLNELAGVFHSYYNKNKVISEDQRLTAARLFLVKAIRIVLQNALKILGVSAPEKM
ncbi:MAG: arginine--tRNA ligase [Deltaproteobacteria bacterium HGW-Deltaproteobacteria-13]|jgi:arginyl-tRNA synthetase|nr:MAG: arginine--tRNA ligase [Deltaproteobacteria bacterium HGW-Deltaproteobacteria-13]